MLKTIKRMLEYIFNAAQNKPHFLHFMEYSFLMKIVRNSSLSAENNISANFH